MDDDIEFINKRLKELKGKKIKLMYDGKIILEKTDPTAQQILRALYNAKGN